MKILLISLLLWFNQAVAMNPGHSLTEIIGACSDPNCHLCSYVEWPEWPVSSKQQWQLDKLSGLPILIGQVSYKRKRRKIEDNRQKKSPEEFKAVILTTYAMEFVQSKENLVYKKESWKNNRKRECEICNRKYGLNYGKSYRLFVHYVETHHPIGKLIYEYPQGSSKCDLCLKDLKERSRISYHIINMHIMQWLEEFHKNFKD